MLARQGVRVATPSTQGTRRGVTKTQWEELWEPMDACTPCTPLPLCGQDGEYIFPMREMPPSGGSEKEKHSILQDNIFIGEYPAICSTPHLPSERNPTAPPYYANYDATQRPQQFPLYNNHSNEKMHRGCSNENPLEGKTEELRELLRKLQAILGKNDK